MVEVGVWGRLRIGLRAESHHTEEVRGGTLDIARGAQTVWLAAPGVDPR